MIFILILLLLATIIIIYFVIVDSKKDGKLRIVKLTELEKYRVEVYKHIITDGYWVYISNEGKILFDTEEEAKKVLEDYREQHPLDKKKQKIKEIEIYREK